MSLENGGGSDTPDGTVTSQSFGMPRPDYLARLPSGGRASNRGAWRKLRPSLFLAEGPPAGIQDLIRTSEFQLELRTS
jgi:hypothetical protein